MSDKLRAEWFWTDRWVSSSAFLLPLEARGLYREMLTRAWSLGGELPADFATICRLINVSEEEWNRCWPLVSKYWKQNGSKLYNETQRAVLMDSLTLSEKRALAGARGGKAKASKRLASEATGVANDVAKPLAKDVAKTCPPSLSLSLSQDPTPNDEDTSPRRKRRRKSYTADFERFWNAYSARRREGKGRAFKAWEKDRNDLPPASESVDEVVAAAAAWAEHWDRIGKETSYIPHPSTWLADRRWEDDPPKMVRAPQSGQPQNGRAQQLREMARSPDPAKREYALKIMRAEGIEP